MFLLNVLAQTTKMNIQELLELCWTMKSSNFSRDEHLYPLDGAQGVVDEEKDDLD